MSKESRTRELQIDTILSAITQAIGGRSAAKDDLLHRFTKRYVGNNPAPISSTHATEQVVKDIAQAWHFVQERKSSRPLISFEEALLEENGRQLPTTVVRVLLDDKPFIVDSLRQALLRSGATIKAVRNPVLRRIVWVASGNWLISPQRATMTLALNLSAVLPARDGRVSAPKA